MKNNILFLFLGALLFFAGFMAYNYFYPVDYTMSDAQAKAYCGLTIGQ